MRGLLAAVLCLAAHAAHAQAPAEGAGPTDRARREDTLRTLEQTARASAESRQRLEREIAGLRADGEKLAAALVATAQRARAAEERVRAAETRLDRVLADEQALRRSLDGRRDMLADILAALQRIGRHPPPALLVRVQDVLDAVRSAILLGALAPSLREEARRLSGELAGLVRLRSSVAADRAALEAEYLALAGERDRVGALVRLRQERLAAAQADIGRERSQGDRLGAEARTLRELIDRTEAEDARLRRAEEEARERFAAAALRDPMRLAPRLPFAEARGTLARPVSGPVVTEFGSPDGSGGTMRGSAISTRPRAIVTVPADGTVVFAGPFRSYGRLLIINAGGGYYLLLAGMERIDVEIGQFVIAGEPVGLMGEVAAPAAALGVVEAAGPVLYVELRKDGGPIDPGPWWAKTQSERARG